MPRAFSLRRPSLALLLALLTTGLGSAGLAYGAGGGEGKSLPGAELDLLWVLPFVGILLSIALMPLFLPRIWHQSAHRNMPCGRNAGPWVASL